MQISGTPKNKLKEEALDFINLYASLGERSEIYLPNDIFDNLKHFVKLCYEEPNDPAKQSAEINDYILKLREAIPGYSDVSLMLYPHANSKAFKYSSKRNKFKQRINTFLDREIFSEEEQKQAKNIIDSHDFSIGTPPVTAHHIDFMSQIQLGDHVRNLRKFRDVIGVVGDVNEAHWNYLMDTLDQMIVQSSHYTTKQERDDFLHRSQWGVNFKGLNGFIRTVVAGSADTSVSLLQEEVFCSESVIVLENPSADELYEKMCSESTKIFVIKVPHMRRNAYRGKKWFPLLTRMVFVDDSLESRSSNTSLVFSFHNGIINTLNKAHTKKLGAPANTQLNIRLILENVNTEFLKEFRTKIENHIKHYEEELETIQKKQLGVTGDVDKNITLYKLDDFSKQIIKDRYSLEKLRDFLFFLENTKNPDNRKSQAKELVEEFEKRTKSYFFSNNSELSIATIVEGGGRNQIKTYGDYLLNKKHSKIDKSIVDRCKVILDMIPNNYSRTLRNHFHKNFGINLFLERYQLHVTKVDNEADNKGRFQNFLIDLGIHEKYNNASAKDQQLMKEFLANLGNLDQTSISDSVQMIIRDLLFNSENLKPYIIFNKELSWEYKDLMPEDRFDLNPFEIEIENFADGRSDYLRLTNKLNRIKSTLALFDETGTLWDRFCENTTILVNDPGNPTGYTDFNSEGLISLLKLLNNSKIILFLDEAYNDAIKLEDETQPKWRTISRYIINNIANWSKISMVSSLSTTKNLGATGNRLGSVVSTPNASEVIDFAKKLNGVEKGNNASLLILNNILEKAERAKKIKDTMEVEMPQNASRQKIKSSIVDFIKMQIKLTDSKNIASKTNQLHKIARFEGSPIHLFLLNELKSLDKLDILGLPDDFKYNDEPFFKYYHKHLLTELNKFRVNRNFRKESNKRLSIAKEVANRVLTEKSISDITLVESDGSYLFNLLLSDFSSYYDLEQFTLALAGNTGVSVIPYKNGMIRFSLGGYLNGTDESYEVFAKEIENALNIFLKYFRQFNIERKDPNNKSVETSSILCKIFKYGGETDFVRKTFEDYKHTLNLKRDKAPSLLINDIRGLYHSSPQESGISITTIGRSENSVIEFQGDEIGRCADVTEFIQSKAFTKIYENMLAQVHKKIPALRGMSFSSVLAKYGKSVILKYINNKKSFQPNRHVFDSLDEMNIMREILIEIENLLFSDSKTKIVTLNASSDNFIDRAKLEGINIILKKFIQEILLHFNLPFEQECIEPSRAEIVKAVAEKFEEVTGFSLNSLNLKFYADNYVRKLVEDNRFKNIQISQRSMGAVIDVVFSRILDADITLTDKILYLYLLQNDEFISRVITKLENYDAQIKEIDDEELRIVVEDVLTKTLPKEFDDITNYIFRKKDIKIAEENLDEEVRKVVLFFIFIINMTKGTNYYDRYNHPLIKIVKTEFRRQNSSFNEMVQHGISTFKEYKPANGLEEFENGKLSWINKIMTQCGVISTEQPVQLHTRIVTDAKKREYPFYKINNDNPNVNTTVSGKNPNDYIKTLSTLPESSLFAERLARFVDNMDTDDYRCKIVKSGVVNELFIFQKGYMKYLTDNLRILGAEDISLKDIKNFVPDTIMFLGAPEKVISFPQVGFFDIPGPNGCIKTIVTPLKQKADYFGDVKKPRLTVMNEKIKEMGGVPKHGSLFAVEEEDGGIFVIEIDGDSGVGKSEMIAALILKWLKDDLPGIRSIKMIAGDMFHVFQDSEGALYAIGTETGDFSRTTDFDPDFIKYYKYLFETSADSNKEDLNSRSTIGGLCEIHQPYKIDIMLTASNYAREEAGITRIENPENYLLYIDSHGERKEKATSQDGPNFQRTLKRYTDNKNIVDTLAKHGNYIDTILDWDLSEIDNKYYLASSYVMIDKIDVNEIVRSIFINKNITVDGQSAVITDTEFDIIKNRFKAVYDIIDEENEATVSGKTVIDRALFSSIYDSLASTPGGQPFIAEDGQNERLGDLINVLKGGKSGKGKAKNVKFAVLSTEIGKKGKEISGPRKAADAMKNMIREVRITNPQIGENKNVVKHLINDKYSHIFNGEFNSNEIWRYNFYIYQLDEMRKADFRRMDDINVKVDLSGISGFEPKKKTDEFSPLLVTPSLNVELSSFSETFNELMSLPNYPEFSNEFTENINKLYIAEGYSQDTIINNMIIQLLLTEDYVSLEDISRGRVIEKVNRETIAAAKHAVVEYLNSKKADEKPAAAPKKATPATSKPKATAKKK